MRKMQAVRHKRGFLKKDRAHATVLASAVALWEEMDTSFTLGLCILARNSEWEQIVSLRLDPLAYHDADRFHRDYIAVNYLRKYPSLFDDSSRKTRALNKFKEAEMTCSETNSRIRLWRRALCKPVREQVESCIWRAQSKIAYVLGSLDLDEVSSMMKWGPGVTSNVAFSDSSAYKKFDAKPECTIGCLHHGWAAVMAAPCWREAVESGLIPHLSCDVNSLGLVPGNRVTMVPKDALIDRSIAVEPHMNIMCQLGFGGVIRRRLKRVGVDLNLGQAVNAEFARVGALTGEYATIDLSSASDTIAYEVVKTLLPEEWFSHLSAVRSPRYLLPGSNRWETYEKFSSMGNGSTFELESLIFWALSSSVLKELALDPCDLCIYGDDIVVPVSAYPLLIGVLDFLGFSVNKRKSFATSQFRESCGAHFFGALDVKPVYVDKELTTLTELMALHNQVVYLAERRNFARWGGLPGCDRLLRRTRQILVEGAPRHDRLFGPKGIGDGVFVGSFDEATPFLSRPKDQWQGHLCLSIVPVVEPRVAQGLSLRTWMLYQVSRREYPTRRVWIGQRDRFCALIQDDEEQSIAPSYVTRGSVKGFRVRRTLSFRPQYIGVWQ